MSRISEFFVLFLSVISCHALIRESDVWSISNVDMRQGSKPVPSIKFDFNRKLHPDCAKSKVTECLIPEEQQISISNRTCSGFVATTDEWQICPGRSPGSTRFRVKRGSYKLEGQSTATVSIEMVRKEDIHE
jgi:hypothetical protein